jgi:voltage-gated potassium channel
MDERSAQLERRFEGPVIVATLLVIPVLVVQSSSYGEPWETAASVLDWAIWATFLTEVVVMLAVVPSRRTWAADHALDVAIVVLTPPFLAGFAAVRLLRLLRLVRLLRLAPLARRVFSMKGLSYAALLAALTAVAGGAAFASIEKNASTADGVYWAVTTMTTVGYGDLSPHTTAGKAVAVVVMLVGIGFVAVLTGAIAQRFLAGEVEREVEEVEEQLAASEEGIIAELRAMQARLGQLEAAVRGRRE